MANSRWNSDGTVSALHKWAGSSLPSLQEIRELQNSYSGRHSPLLHRNVRSGHLRHKGKCRRLNQSISLNMNTCTYCADNGELHPTSSSPCGHCFLPSHSDARETHLPLLLQVNDSLGHSNRPFALSMEHSSSDASLQSGRPSHTKYQLMQ